MELAKFILYYISVPASERFIMNREPYEHEAISVLSHESIMISRVQLIKYDLERSHVDLLQNIFQIAHKIV